MKLFDLIKISFLNFKRNKSSVVIAILISVSIISVIFGISFNNSFNDYWIKYIEKNIDFRIFAVYYEDFKDKKFVNINRDEIGVSEKVKLLDEALKEAMEVISDIPHIESVTTSDGYMAGIDSIDYNGKRIIGGLSLIGVPSNTFISLIKGETLDKYDKNDNVMICSNYLHSDWDDFDPSQNTKADYLLNKDLKITFSENKILDYKIIGLYDKVSTYAIGNACYTSYENLKEIKTESYLKNKEINSQSQGYNGEGLYLMIDNRDNLKVVETKLAEHKIYIDPIVYINTELVDKVLQICSYITIVTLIVTVIIVLMNLLINLQEREKEFFLYNALGYSKVNITKLVFAENIIVGIFSFICAIFLSIIVFELFENIVLTNNTRLYLLNITLDFNGLVYGSIASLIIPIISSVVIIFVNTFNKNNIME